MSGGKVVISFGCDLAHISLFVLLFSSCAVSVCGVWTMKLKRISWHLATGREGGKRSLSNLLIDLGRADIDLVLSVEKRGRRVASFIDITADKVQDTDSSPGTQQLPPALFHDIRSVTRALNLALYRSMSMSRPGADVHVRESWNSSPVRLLPGRASRLVSPYLCSLSICEEPRTSMSRKEKKKDSSSRKGVPGTVPSRGPPADHSQTPSMQCSPESLRRA